MRGIETTQLLNTARNINNSANLLKTMNSFMFKENVDPHELVPKPSAHLFQGTLFRIIPNSPSTASPSSSSSSKEMSTTGTVEVYDTRPQSQSQSPQLIYTFPIQYVNDSLTGNNEIKTNDWVSTTMNVQPSAAINLPKQGTTIESSNNVYHFYDFAPTQVGFDFILSSSSSGEFGRRIGMKHDDHIFYISVDSSSFDVSVPVSVPVPVSVAL